MLHMTAKTPLIDRRMAAEHISVNDDEASTQKKPGNKEAIWASER